MFSALILTNSSTESSTKEGLQCGFCEPLGHFWEKIEFKVENQISLKCYVRQNFLLQIFTLPPRRGVIIKSLIFNGNTLDSTLRSTLPFHSQPSSRHDPFLTLLEMKQTLLFVNGKLSTPYFNVLFIDYVHLHVYQSVTLIELLCMN
ncbi:hypothetical protein EGR_03557 [Echinococcus granulosus]|uniref:Uncharacterized protein n=1 Tax=Echinococcus granulosus TaxID=6210 RepID=W6UKA0_ECHGR|nr:hypothetical protein EGR_03557 [Echinococcus granulosus]EUB61493.1 hypothetical protein EGR_03557 [Echinococcus granulosus]